VLLADRSKPAEIQSSFEEPLRKPRLVLISIFAVEIPCFGAGILCSSEIIPCPVALGISLQAFEFARV
jgi:hypothetical protein